jgi:nitroreductase
MDAIEAIRKRRSIRKYKDDAIPEELLSTILECGRLAPSAGNRQPWVFIVVRDSSVKDGLMKAAGNQPQVGQAPIVIVVCADPEISAARYDDRGRSLYVFQDTAAAVENMMIAATSFGLGTCWIGAFNETEARRVLDLPSRLRPVAMVSMGYPDQERGPRDLRPTQEVIWTR